MDYAERAVASPAYLGYGEGVHAPGVKGDMQAAVDVGHHLLLSHGLATQALRAVTPVDTRIGIALNLFPTSVVMPAPRRCAPLSALMIANAVFAHQGVAWKNLLLWQVLEVF